MKPLNQNVPTYEQTADIIIPEKTSKDIKPKEIFEGLKQSKTSLSKATNVKENKPKKRPTKKGGRKKK